MSGGVHPSLRCRQITPADFDAVLDLLGRGFPDRRREWWAAALRALEARSPPEGCARFGYLLEAGGRPAGVHVLIFNEPGEAPDGEVRCHASGWYVDPAFRSHAALLASLASRQRHVTYVNTTGAPHTWQTLSAVGYRRYTEGQFAALPALSRGGRARVSKLTGAHTGLPEHRLLAEHEALGCVALVCQTAAGEIPFVFKPRRIRGAPLGVMQLVWCRDTADFLACAGPIGRYLLARGVACVLLDATGPINGLAGRYFPDRNPRYFKGPTAPRLNDLAFSETVLLDGWAARAGGAAPARLEGAAHVAWKSTAASWKPTARATPCEARFSHEVE